ncbi:MAG: sigma-70 family RNA polymerase sigma factor [Phycisphaerae bacterium]|nr:sigma-70 family RNA polymerase sigma factor [Phycisphaerae bacterium]
MIQQPPASGPAAPNAGTFPEIVTAHQERVARLAKRLLGWSDDVQDVVQEVFVRALTALPSFREQSQLDTWLFRITVNECRRRQRWRLFRLRRHSETEHECEARVPAGPDADLLDEETFGRVRDAVRCLKPRDREVIVLRYFESMPSAEIGAVLNISPGAADVRLNRARQRLRGLLSGLVEE